MKNETISIRITSDIKNELFKIAKEKEIGLSQLLRVVIDEYLKKVKN